MSSFESASSSDEFASLPDEPMAAKGVACAAAAAAPAPGTGVLGVAAGSAAYGFALPAPAPLPLFGVGVGVGVEHGVDGVEKGEAAASGALSEPEPELVSCEGGVG